MLWEFDERFRSGKNNTLVRWFRGHFVFVNVKMHKVNVIRWETSEIVGKVLDPLKRWVKIVFQAILNQRRFHIVSGSIYW